MKPVVQTAAGQRLVLHQPTTDWRRVAGRMRAELDRVATALVRHANKSGDVWWAEEKLAGRPKELAELVVKATLARGRRQVVIGKLEELGEQIGIGKNHLRGVFHVLECARMVKLDRGADGWTLTVLPHSAEWQGVTWRYEEKSLLDYLAALDRAPGQVQGELLPLEDVETTAKPAFTRAEAERSCAEAERSSQNGNRPVPVLGTEGPSLKASSLQAQSAWSLETLSSLKLQVQSSEEAEACRGMCAVLGEDVWEGHTAAQRYAGGNYKDGAKWRLRWRTDRAKTVRVFLAMIEDMQAGKPAKRPGGRAHWLWGEFK